MVVTSHKKNKFLIFFFICFAGASIRGNEMRIPVTYNKVEKITFAFTFNFLCVLTIVIVQIRIQKW